MTEFNTSNTKLDPKDRRRLKQLAVVPLAFALAAYVGQILTSVLLSSQPLLLISFNATDPVLLLAAHQTEAVPFLIVGTARLFAPDLFLHQLGWEFGPATKDYLKSVFGPRSGLIRTIAALERWFPRVGWLLLFAIPGYPMCLLAGIARMRRVPFIAFLTVKSLNFLLVGGAAIDPSFNKMSACLTVRTHRGASLLSEAPFLGDMFWNLFKKAHLLLY